MGLIKSRRTSNNYRVYRSEDVKTIERIQLFIMAGVPLKKIKYIVSCTIETEVVLMSQELEAMFLEELKNVDERIESLKKGRKILLEILRKRKVVD